MLAHDVRPWQLVHAPRFGWGGVWQEAQSAVGAGWSNVLGAQCAVTWQSEHVRRLSAPTWSACGG